MAVSPLSPQGFKAPNRSRCRLWALNLTTSGVVMDQDWTQTDSWHAAKENVSEVVSTVGLNTGMLNCLAAFRGLQAAQRSGLDQSQVAEETTTCWLCLHAQSNPASGHAIVEVLFYVHLDTLAPKIITNSSYSHVLLVSKSVCGSVHRVWFYTDDENQK